MGSPREEQGPDRGCADDALGLFHGDFMHGLIYSDSRVFPLPVPSVPSQPQSFSSETAEEVAREAMFVEAGFQVGAFSKWFVQFIFAGA